MAHEYSVMIHNYLSSKMETAVRMEQKAIDNCSKEDKAFYRGQIEELKRLRSYLTENIDLDTHTYFE